MTPHYVSRVSPNTIDPGARRTQFGIQAEGYPLDMLSLAIAAVQTVTVVPDQAHKTSAWSMKAPNTNYQLTVVYNNSLTIDAWTQGFAHYSTRTHEGVYLGKTSG